MKNGPPLGRLVYWFVTPTNSQNLTEIYLPQLRAYLEWSQTQLDRLPILLGFGLFFYGSPSMTPCSQNLHILRCKGIMKDEKNYIIFTKGTNTFTLKKKYTFTYI